MNTDIPLSLVSQLLALIARRMPGVYDIDPRGPLSEAMLNPQPLPPHEGPGGRFGRLSQVALNPQPLPPHELGAAIAAEHVRVAWLADRFGLDAERASGDLDDWCPTRPKRLKLPPWWPPVPDPDPHPNWFAEFHLGFAMRMAMASSALQGTPLGESFANAMRRSLSAIESSTGD